jgi:NADH dehydrogenase [ubiquinone] 1 alpha subcomplex assembly factor 5
MSDPEPFDRHARRLRAVRRASAAHLYFERLTEEILERLAFVKRDFSSALVLGWGAAGLEKEFADKGMAVTMAGPAALAGDLSGDEDRTIMPQSQYDLVVSVFGLDSINDLLGALIVSRRALKPDGLLIATLPSARSLSRLRAAAMTADLASSGGVTPHVHPQIEVRSGGDLLTRAGFVAPVADVIETQVRYGDLPSLIRDLRAIGGTSLIKGRRPVSRQWLAYAAQAFLDEADAQGRVTETVNTMVLTAWAPPAGLPERPKLPQRARIPQLD